MKIFPSSVDLCIYSYWSGIIKKRDEYCTVRETEILMFTRVKDEHVDYSSITFYFPFSEGSRSLAVVIKGQRNSEPSVLHSTEGLSPL